MATRVSDRRDAPKPSWSSVSWLYLAHRVRPVRVDPWVLRPRPRVAEAFRRRWAYDDRPTADVASDLVDTRPETGDRQKRTSAFERNGHGAKATTQEVYRTPAPKGPGVLRPIDAGVSYPGRSWACKGCQFAHACKPRRPKLALVA